MIKKEKMQNHSHSIDCYKNETKKKFNQYNIFQKKYSDKNYKNTETLYMHIILSY